MFVVTMCLIHSIGGAFTRQPEELNSKLSTKSSDLVNSEAESLKEIYDYNPLLFDFVLKRTLRLPGTSGGFPASVFMVNPALAT